MQLEITDEQAREIQKQAQHQRMKERQKLSLLVMLGAVCLLGVVGGYLRLEEATKGYYTRCCGLTASAFVLAIVAGLYGVPLGSGSVDALRQRPPADPADS